MEDRIIVAKFGRGNTCRTAPQFRLNRGQILQFEGIELPTLYQAHFSNSPYGQAKTVIGDSTGVQIPQEYFVPGKEIYVWIYVNTEDYGITKYQITIPVSPRADITDQQPDPEEQTVIDQAIALLNDTNEHVQDRIDASLAAAKASGEFDGVDGSTIWTYLSTPITPNYTFYKYLLRGTAGAVPKIEDLIIMGNDMYKIASIGEYTVLADYYLRLKGTDGRDGVSPTVVLNTSTPFPGTRTVYTLAITDTNGTKQYNIYQPTDLFINISAEDTVSRHVYRYTIRDMVYDGEDFTDFSDSPHIEFGPSLSDDEFWDRIAAVNNTPIEISLTVIFIDTYGMDLYTKGNIPLSAYREEDGNRVLSFATIMPDGEEHLMFFNFVIAYINGSQTCHLYCTPVASFLSNDDLSGVVYYDREMGLNDEEQALARDNIGAASIEDLGTVFDIKGEVATASDLPASGNRVGDVYYVIDQSVAYVWLETNEHPNGYWEQFGEPIDLSNYATKQELNTKVDKVSGKGLSTNDYSTAEKSKLASIAEGAQVNVIERIKKNGVALPINLKAVDITVPEKTSDLNNDSGFISQVFKVTVTYENGAYVSDKTYNEILAVVEANKPIELLYSVSNGLSVGADIIYQYAGTNSVSEYQKWHTFVCAGAENISTITIGNNGFVIKTESPALKEFDFYIDSNNDITIAPTWQEVEDTAPNCVAKISFESGSPDIYLTYSGQGGGVFSTLSDSSYILLYHGTVTDTWTANWPSIPSTASDVGAIPAPFNPSAVQDLVFNGTNWVAQDKNFIVTLTPTSADLSGTMNKTPAEIISAIQAGKMVVFDLTGYFSVPISGIVPAANNSAFIILTAINGTNLYLFTTSSVNSTYAVSTYILPTVEKVNSDQGVAHAGDFLVVGNDGIVTPVTMQAWQGGNY